jgi:isopenicillin-N epimerase
MPTRRSFIASADAAGTAAITLGNSLLAQVANAPAMPDRVLLDRNEDAYWAALRKQFPIPANEVYLNNGTCGSTPYPVLKEVFAAYEHFEQMDDPDPEQYPLFGYGAFRQYREPLAKFVGVSTDELAIVRNATEANAIMANGLDLKAGDEVLLSDQEHPSGNSPWDMRAKRYGIVVKRFKIPVPPKSPEEILNIISEAITPRTRVIFVSHITTVTGVVMPVKEISALAKSKGTISMIDGAQVIGMMPLNIRDIGCDMYGSSPHKWLMAPKGTGFIYVRDEMIDRMWSNTTTEGWEDKKMRAQRFQQYGSANLPVVAGLVAAIEFHEDIGIARIEKRERMLADYIHSEMVKRGAESWTSADAAMRCAIVTVNVPPVPRMPLEKWLWATHKIRIRGGDPHKLRLSTPYYLQKAEIDRFLEKFDEFKRGAKA